LPNLRTERNESLKAGILAALSFAVADLVFILVNTFVLARQWEFLSPLQVSININIFLQTGIGAITGLLFGITYRYIIRGDNNSHLKDGAILAFGIVRALALLETTIIFTDRFWSWTILSIESIICFAIARWSLDFALKRKLIKPFI
jgi:hypothetical protein